MNCNETYDIFISYRHEKNEIADRVYARLNLYGYEVCFDKASYTKSNKGLKKLTEDIAKCTDFLIFLSKNTFKRGFFNKREVDWVEREIRTAFATWNDEHNDASEQDGVNIVVILFPNEDKMPDNLPKDLEGKIKDIPAVYHCNFSIAHYNVFINELVAKLKSKPKHLPNSIVLDHRLDRSMEGVLTISRELLVQKI